MSRPAIVRPPISLADALGVVGLASRRFIDVLGEVVRDGEAYLVGSLASGFGNHASDVDVHVLHADRSESSGPTMYFVDGVAVDVERYPADLPAALVRRAESSKVVQCDIGPVAIEQALADRDRRFAARWPYAIALRDGARPIFADHELRALLPHLVRLAIDKAVLLGSLARLGMLGGLDDSALAYLWIQAERSVLEVRCRAAGDVASGDKWLPDRARRLGLAVASPTGTEDGFLRALADCGLGHIDLEAVTRVRRAENTRVAAIAGRRFLVNRHDQLSTHWVEVSGSLAEVIGRVEPSRLAEAVRRSEVDLVVDADRLREALR